MLSIMHLAADCLKDWKAFDGVVGATFIDAVTSSRNEPSNHYDPRIWPSCPCDMRASSPLLRGDTSAAEFDQWLASEDDHIASRAPESTVIFSWMQRMTRPPRAAADDTHYGGRRGVRADTR